MQKLLDDFLHYTKFVRRKSENTIKSYKSDIKAFISYCETNNIKIEEVGQKIVEKHLSSITNRDGEPCEISTLKRNIISLKGFFKYLKTENIVKDNPLDGIEIPKLPTRMPVYLKLNEAKSLLEAVKTSSKKETLYKNNTTGVNHVTYNKASGKYKVQFSKDGKMIFLGEYKTLSQAKKIADANKKEYVNTFIEKRDYAILTFFLNCGMRLSELIGIDIDKISGDILTVIGKGNKERTVYLNDSCIFALNDYMLLRPKEISHKALFVSEEGNRISKSTLNQMLKKYLEEANLDSEKYSIHKLRHTAATLMYKYGKVDIRALQRILGHEQISTSEIYTHCDDEQLREAVNSNPLNKKCKGVI